METLAEAATDVHPRKNHRNPAYDKTTRFGYILLVASTLIYTIAELTDIPRGDDNFPVFFVHYFLALTFIIRLIATKSYGIFRSWRNQHLHHTVILLQLFLISAYALNRVIPVFENSVSWLCVFIVLTSISMLSFQFSDMLPTSLQRLQHILLGSGMILYLYMTLFVANLYMFGMLGILLIGIGAHIFMPVLLLIASGKLLYVANRSNHMGYRWALGGAMGTLVITGIFVLAWNTRKNTIDRLANQSVIHADTEMPAWVMVAQSVDNDWLTRRILKSTLVYTISLDHFRWDPFPATATWEERRKHDPLIFLASMTGTGTLSREDRIRILTADNENRHKAEERLWAGDNLVTSYIVTDVDLYPDLRLAYSENYFNVRNTASPTSRWWGNSQEAVYTFQLPEGSVVTSLSLWVAGKEEKAILTSKQKATEAYTTIVGREMRDPSVVHWREGNTVSVRVFPCTPDEERKFKLGITSPLPVVDNRIVFRNPTFLGPDPAAATQTARIRIIGNASNIELPGGFTRNTNGEYISERAYDPTLEITIPNGVLRDSSFSFNGYTYSLTEHRPSLFRKRFSRIYLDINDSWTKDDIEQMQLLLGSWPLYVYADATFVALNESNWDDATEEATRKNFTLFPFHRITDPESSLVVTKGKDFSPQLRDVKNSAFATGVSSYFGSWKKACVFNLDGRASSYIRSLRELRAFHFAQGSPSNLQQLLQSNSFPSSDESEQRVVLHESNMAIIRKETSTATPSNNAPDHLARLFAYNNIMRQVGANFFTDDFVNEKLVDEAATAYVVSPVSSLIVLETKADYERFGIKDKDNSLHNAGKDSSGAVPEPHEWALIIVFIGFIVFQFLRRRGLNLSPIIK